MRKLAAWTLVRQSNALVVVSGFAVLGLVFAPLLVFSLAMAGLVTLRLGGQRGLQTILGSLLFVGVLAAIVGQQMWIDVVILATLWAATWGLALIYRRSATMAWMVIGAGIAGLMTVVGVYVMYPEPEQFWLGILEQNVRPIFAEAQIVQTEAELDKLMSGLSKVLTGGMAGLLSVVLIVSLLLARWWQAVLFNPGGFRKEFHSLNLGRPAGVVMLTLIAAALLGQFQLAVDMATVVWLLFFFQGLAVAHSLVAQVGMNVGWLVSIYMLLMLIPHFASPVLSGLGFVDTWFDFRRRVVEKLNKS